MGGICNVHDENVCYIAAQNFLHRFILCFTSGVICERHIRLLYHLLIYELAISVVWSSAWFLLIYNLIP